MDNGDFQELNRSSDFTEYGNEIEVEKEADENLDLEKYEEFDIVSIEEVTIDVLTARMLRVIQEVLRRGKYVANQLFDVAVKLLYRSTMLDESETNPVISLIMKGTTSIILNIEERDDESSISEQMIMKFVTTLSIFSKSQKCDGLLKKLIIFIDKFFNHPESKIRSRICHLIGLLFEEVSRFKDIESEEVDNEFMFGDDMSQNDVINEILIEDAIVNRWAQNLSLSVFDRSPIVRAMSIFALSKIDHQKIIKNRKGHELSVNDIIFRSLSDIDDTVRSEAVKGIEIITPIDIDICFDYIERCTENKIRQQMAVKLATSIHLLSFSEAQRFRFINMLRKSESSRMRYIIDKNLVGSWLKCASESINELSLFASSEKGTEIDTSGVTFPTIILEYLNPMVDRDAAAIFFKFTIRHYLQTENEEVPDSVLENFLRSLTEFNEKKCDKFGLVPRSMFKLVPDDAFDEENERDDAQWITRSYYRIFILRNLLDVIFQLTNRADIRDRTLRFLVLGVCPFSKQLESFCESYFVNMDLVEKFRDVMEAMIIDVLHIFDVIIKENYAELDVTMYRQFLERALNNTKFAFSPELVDILTTAYVELNEDIDLACEWVCYTANSVIMMNEKGIAVGEDLEHALTDGIIIECMLRRGTAMLLALCKHPKVEKCNSLMTSVFKFLLPSLLSNANEEIKFDGIELIGYSSVIDFENAIPYLKLCPLLMSKSNDDREKAVFLNSLIHVSKKQGYTKVAKAIFEEKSEEFQRILIGEYSKIDNGTIEKCQATRDILSLFSSQSLFWPEMLANVMKVVFDPNMKRFHLVRFFDKFLQTSVKSLRNRIHLMKSYLLCVEQYEDDECFSLDLMTQKVCQHFNNYAVIELENVNDASVEFSVENELCHQLIRKAKAHPRSKFVKIVFIEFSTQLNIDFIPLQQLRKVREDAKLACDEAEDQHFRSSMVAIKRFISKCDKTINIKNRIEKMNNGEEETDEFVEPMRKKSKYEKEVKKEETEELQYDEIVLIETSDESRNEEVLYVPRLTRSRKRKMIDEDKIKEEEEKEDDDMEI